MHSLYIICLDRHHLGDALFLKSLAQNIASSDDGGPAPLVVHGSGEKVERTLEARGYFPERTDGVLTVESEEQRRLVERAVREMNQEIVGTLTDEVVAAVGIQGVDRGLFQREEGGELRASSVGWISALIKQHVVPVVSALVEDTETGAVEEVPTVEAVVALAQAMEASFDPVACLFTRGEQAGLPGENQGILKETSAEAVSEQWVPEPRIPRRLVGTGIPVLITSPEGLFSNESPVGTWVRGE